MIPNIHLPEQYMFEQHQTLLHEMEQRCLLAGLPRHQCRLACRLAAMVEGLLIGLSSSLKRFEAAEEQVAYDRGSARQRRARRLAAQSPGDIDLRKTTSTRSA
jgi:hypothetical protein